jgi:Zn-dependent protease/uncharacterized Zn finger protein (UPF0148 family)
MSATVLPPESVAVPPPVIHNCPNCSHWLPDGTLACPDCQTLTYGEHLTELATDAQQLEQQQKWAEARDRWKMALLWLPEETRQSASIQQHIAQLDARLKAVDDQKAKWTKRLGPFAPIALFLIKFKTYLFLALKFKFLLSFVAYFGIYWALFGWRFAVALAVSVLLHEMGHYVAAKRRGLQVDLPMFLPGLGAYVRWYGQGISREDLASIALAGPFAGMLVALASYGIFLGTHSPFFQMMAFLGAWLNLFNLFPVPLPFIALDGAQASYALSRMQRLLVAATFLIFFGLTVSQNINGDLFGPNTHWMFLILGGGMAWRSLANDVPEEASSKSFAYFQGLAIVLGILLLRTQIPGM